MAEKQCGDCGLEISARAKRCRPCASKSNWEKPGFRDNIAAAVKANWQESPGRRREASESQRARWEDPEFRYRVIEGGKISWQDPERQHKQSKLVKRLWQDPEYRRKISTSAKAQWEDPECHQQMSAALNTSHQTPEYRCKRSEIAKRNWQDPEYRQGLSVKLKAAHARGCYDRVYQSPTSIELSLAAALDICGIAHQSQYRPNGCRFIFDEFVVPNILIEANGDYWHGPKRPENQGRDKEKATWAEGHGYILIVMWEHEINKWGAWSLVHKRILSLLP